jgi:hypothetical protein
MSSPEDATNFLVSGMRANCDRFAEYGYQVYLRRVLIDFVTSRLTNVQGLERESAIHAGIGSESPAFFAAAWDLCRRGILRPGVRQLGSQATDDGSGGGGYSLTPFGVQWLKEHTRDDYVPTEPGRFAEMLAPHGKRFGPAFQERAQEAIRCYGAHAYLACCAMCGAAAEAILLSMRIAQTSDSDGVLAAYLSQGGRGRVEKELLGKATDAVRRELGGFTTLLKYWRDSAAHGAPSGITDNEAYTSLALLLRFAQFANDRWSTIVDT